MVYRFHDRTVEITNAALFDRLSQEESVDLGSHINHQERLVQFVKANGIPTKPGCKFFFKAVPGDEIEYQPRFKELVTRLQQRHFDALVALHPDRLSRDTFLSAWIHRLVTRNDIALIFVDFPQLDVCSAMGEDWYLTSALQAHREKKSAVRRATSSLPYRLSEGYSIGGRPRYGYYWAEGKVPGRRRPVKVLVVDPKEAEVVRQVFRLFVHHKKILRVAKILNAKGYRTRTHDDKPATSWSPTTIRNMLTCPMYHGQWQRNRLHAVKRFDKLAKGKTGTYWEYKDEEDWVNIECPAIVGREEFDTVQEILQRINYHKPRSKVVYLFSGMKCGQCKDGKLYGHRACKSKTSQRRPGRAKYRCHNRHKHCGFCVEVAAFDNCVLQSLRQLALNSEFLKGLEASCEEQIKQKAKLEYEVGEAEREAKALDNKIAYLVELMSNGTLSKDTGEDQVRQADEQKTSLEQQVHAKRLQLSNTTTYDDYVSYIGTDLSWVVKQLYRFPRDKQSEVLKLLIHGITVYRGRVECQLVYLPGLKEQIVAQMENSTQHTPSVSETPFAEALNSERTLRG